MPENILIDTAGAITTITFNRPKALNALNTATLTELGQALDHLPPQTRVVILTGGESKAFVAGADIAEMKGLDPHHSRAFGELGHRVLNKLANPHFVSIAAVNGFALGGGLELAVACDLIYAAEGAKLGLPEVSLGLIPGFGGTQRLQRLVGRQAAMELIFTGDHIDAARAKDLGLVLEVLPKEQLAAKVKSVAEKILTRGPSAVRAAKRAIIEGREHNLPTGLRIELDSFGDLFGQAETNEGLTAFLEKRTPNWPA